jgi:CheY-like chemotaxis protein
MPLSTATRPFPSILLIDDDAISREVMQMTLEMQGFAVQTAEDGAAALALLGSQTAPPEVILMDTQMPGLSGVELVRALRGAAQARIVAISASEPGEAIRRAADGFLLKPIQMEALIVLLDAAEEDRSAKELNLAPPETAGAGADANAGLVDAVVLGKLRAMMPASAVREIYAATASDLKMRLVSLQAAMEASNTTEAARTAEVARIAHAIKGGCAMVGLTGARDAAARLEISNLPVSWPEELTQMHFALQGLEGMLGDDFPA